MNCNRSVCKLGQLDSRWMILTIIRHVAEMFAHSGDVLSQKSINSSRCCGTSVLLCRNSNISSMLLWYLQPQTLYGICNTTTRFALREAKVDFPILESGFSKHACFCLSFIQLSFSLLCSCVYYFAFQVAIQWVSYTNIAVVITD